MLQMSDCETFELSVHNNDSEQEEVNSLVEKGTILQMWTQMCFLRYL